MMVEDIARLNKMFKEYIDGEFSAWKSRNPCPKILPWRTDVTFDNFHEWNKSWLNYISPLSIKWWDGHGYIFSMPGRVVKKVMENGDGN